MTEANAHRHSAVLPFSPECEQTHTPAEHVSEAHKAHISQFKGATMTGLQELLTEVQADPLHL